MAGTTTRCTEAAAVCVDGDAPIPSTHYCHIRMEAKRAALESIVRKEANGLASPTEDCDRLTLRR